jgi:hypothetical protein
MESLLLISDLVVFLQHARDILDCIPDIKCELKKINICYRLGLQVEMLSQHQLPNIVGVIQWLRDSIHNTPDFENAVEM